ncbi:MAG: lysophospholipid acyltransferase family protein [bacterium]|nr:lysophospholipid acyltransferase family protein [bacterium]
MNRLRKITRPIRHFFVYLFFIEVYIAVNAMPRPVSLFIFTRSSRLVSRIFRKDKERSIANIRSALGVDRARAAEIYEGTFDNFARNFIDLCLASGRKPGLVEEVVEIDKEDLARLREYMAEGKGVLGLTAHYSNWELLGGFVARELGGIYVIAQTIYDSRVDNFLNWMRRRLNVTAIQRDEPASRVTGLLRDGEFVGVLADQNIPSIPGVFVDFFGRPAHTPVGPALMARRSGALLMPIHIRRLPDDSYRIIVEPAISRAEEGKLREKLTEDTQTWSFAVERWIREAPEQWVWLHQRWD